MKSRLTALLLTLALLLTALPVCAAAEETSSTRMPLYDVFPLQLDDNTVLELPIDWGYQFVELEGVPPIAYAVNDSKQLLMMVKIPADYTPNEASDRLGLTSFIPEAGHHDPAKHALAGNDHQRHAGGAGGDERAGR